MSDQTNRDMEPLQLPELQQFTAVRRQAVRSAVLAAHGREAVPLSEEQTVVAVESLKIALAKLRGHIERLRPLLEKHLDDAISAAARGNDRVRIALYNHGISLGFAQPQIDWIWDELRRLEGTSSADLLPNGVDDLLTIVDASAADDQILAAGFPRVTGQEQRDGAVLQIVNRFVSRGVTTSAYLVLALALIAALIAAGEDTSEDSARLLGAQPDDHLLDENTLADERLASGNRPA
jgi:hypothetical protein